MTDRQLTKFILEKKRLPLSFDDYTNFIVLLLPPTFSALGVSMINAYYKFGDSIWLVIGGAFVILLGLLFMYLTIIRLKQNISFSIIDNGNHLDIDQIATLVDDNFKFANIKIDDKLNLLIVSTQMTAFSWGEKITIILNGSEILINSRPSSSRQPFTITRDVNNIKKIRNLLKGQCS